MRIPGLFDARASVATFVPGRMLYPLRISWVVLPVTPIRIQLSQMEGKLAYGCTRERTIDRCECGILLGTTR